MSIDLYEALGIDRAAGPEAIKRAYRKAAKAAHPDGGGDRERFALVTTARDVLGDEKRRAKYDKTGKIDEVGPDQTEAESMQIVMQAISQVLGVIEQRGGRFEEFDVITDAVEVLRESIAKMREQERQAKATAEKMRKLAKRFKAKKGKPNRIAPMFEARAREFDENAVTAVRFVEPHNLAIAILKDHSFSVEATMGMLRWP